MNYSRRNNGDYCTTYFPFDILGKKNMGFKDIFQSKRWLEQVYIYIRCHLDRFSPVHMSSNTLPLPVGITNVTNANATAHARTI